MTCSIEGCYAKTFRRNLCRNHFYMWIDQTVTTPRFQERKTSVATPASTRGLRAHNTPPYNGPCRCDVPRPHRIPWFGCYECLNCGMPLPTERIIYDRATGSTVVRLLR